MLDIAPIEQELERRRTHGLVSHWSARADDLLDEVKRLRAMLPEQYAAGFRDATAAAAALDTHASFVVGPDAG